jgi:Leucine-rich repeat (LRR) protein
MHIRLSFALQNQFDSIDLSDNAIVRLEGFPRLPRLKMLLLSNNRIAKIARNLESEQQRHTADSWQRLHRQLEHSAPNTRSNYMHRSWHVP